MQSTAGREFCFVDVIHPEGTFKDCDFPTYKEMFDCCSELAKGDKNLEFDCQTELPGGGGKCKTQAECYENYTKGLQEVEKAKAAEVNNDGDDSGDGSGTILIIVLSLLIIGICCFTVYKTKCCSQSCCAKKGQQQEVASAEAMQIDMAKDEEHGFEDQGDENQS